MWYINLSRFDVIVALRVWLLYFRVEINLSGTRNHTLTLIFSGFSYALSPALVCVHMFVCSCSVSACGHFHAVCRSDGELFHVVRNEIRPTPCSLLSGLYLSNRLAQVISFLQRLVPARVKSELEHRVMSMRDEETGREWHEKSRRGPEVFMVFILFCWKWDHSQTQSALKHFYVWWEGFFSVVPGLWSHFNCWWGCSTVYVTNVMFHHKHTSMDAGDDVMAVTVSQQSHSIS